MKKNTFGSILCAAFIAASSIVPVGASSLSTTASAQGKTSFKKAWSKTWSFDCDDIFKGSATIGYDTFLTNEDYIKSFGTLANDKNHLKYCKVKNSNGSTDESDKTTGSCATGKADIKHTGASVTYYVYWGAVSNTLATIIW